MKLIHKMKKLFTFIFLTLSIASYSRILSGSYISDDEKYCVDNTKVAYTFVGDSLYIDTYESGCNITCLSLEKINNNDYNATEIITDVYNSTAITILYKMSFIPCAWDDNCYIVCRNNEVIDIIRKVN